MVLHYSLNGKVAIVTGAAQGIGKAIAEILAAEGADVVVSDINGEKAKDVANNIRALGLKTDVTDQDEVENMIRTSMEHYGTVDILVNNAGIMRRTPVEQINLKEWEDVLNVNLTGVFLCIKSVLGIMKEKNSVV